MITDSMVFFVKPFITKVCFKHTQNVFQDIPESPSSSKNVAKKNNLRRSQFSKKRGGGGVRRGMIMITDSMVFFNHFMTKKNFKNTQNLFQDIPELPN